MQQKNKWSKRTRGGMKAIFKFLFYDLLSFIQCLPSGLRHVSDSIPFGCPWLFGICKEIQLSLQCNIFFSLVLKTVANTHR